LQETRWNTRTS